MNILSPAGSYDDMVAAIKFGADSVYLGLEDFSARNAATNFRSNELADAVLYCHKRGVEVFVAINTLVYDHELSKIQKLINTVYKSNADGIIVQDWGVVSMIQKIAPSIKLIASTQMTINNLAGVRILEEQGFDTVVLPRELTKNEIKEICVNTDINVEVFCHGALCVCYSGQCYFSSFIGERSGNRGRCAQPCRMCYDVAQNQKKGDLLSTKDLSLIDHLGELREIGVDTLKIEGRLKGQYYTAAVTDVYKRVETSSQMPTREDYAILDAAFMRGGYVDGYFRGIKDKRLFNYNKNENPYSNETKKLQKHYDSILRQQGDFYKMPISLDIIISDKIEINYLFDDETYSFVSKVEVQEAKNAPLTKEKIISQLSKTGSEPFYFDEIKLKLDNNNVFIPVSEINQIRREISENLEKSLKITNSPKPFYCNVKERPACDSTDYIVTVKTAQQLKWVRDFWNSTLIFAKKDAILEYEKKYGEISNVGLMCERIPSDEQLENTKKFLNSHKSIKKIMAGNIGTVEKFRGKYEIYGDFTLNATNTLSAQFLRECGVSSLNASVELNLKNIKNLTPDNMEIFVLGYGNLPLMITEACLKSSILSKCNKAPVIMKDRKNEEFIIDCEDCTKNVIYNSYPLMMSENQKDIRNAGIKTLRLHFTFENKAQVEEILFSFKAEQNPLTKFTRGHFYRGAI